MYSVPGRVSFARMVGFHLVCMDAVCKQVYSGLPEFGTIYLRYAVCTIYLVTSRVSG